MRTDFIVTHKQGFISGGQPPDPRCGVPCRAAAIKLSAYLAPLRLCVKTINLKNRNIPLSNSNSNLQLTKGTPVLAPLNGTFYRSDAPGKSEMAGDGAAVKTGQAVCVVEAMKLFNPIKAPTAGKITFLVEHGKPVTKGQPVASIV